MGGGPRWRGALGVGRLRVCVAGWYMFYVWGGGVVGDGWWVVAWFNNSSKEVGHCANRVSQQRRDGLAVLYDAVVLTGQAAGRLEEWVRCR
jgi:hypothetical protein